jgi:predicted acylesterase/phospholipase RssA
MTIRELKVRYIQKIKRETVLVMQGGGSLGAYECGAYKGLARHGIQFDIVAGTSIGAINAAVIAGSKSGDSLGSRRIRKLVLDHDLLRCLLSLILTLSSSVLISPSTFVETRDYFTNPYL